MLFHEPTEIFSRHPEKSFILERNQKLRTRSATSGKTFTYMMVHEGGLAAATHADDSQRLVADLGQADIARSADRDRCGEGLLQLQA
jgi:hypothetical protein